MSQFLNTLNQIVHSDSVGALEGILRHSQWQFRKLFGRFPCRLPIAASQLHVESPCGVAALVNAMGEYDYNNMELLRLALSRGNNTFFDIGANIGTYTLITSEVCGSQVVSIEPHPATFTLLQQNVSLNARTNVFCLNLALSNTEGDVLLSDLPEPSINRILAPGDSTQQNVRVRSRRLDRVCREMKLSPDFIKIDVEGFEERVLAGFGEFVGKAKMILIERGESQKLRDLLHTADYDGPWYCHFKQRHLSKKRQTRPEDPIYLGQRFISELKEMKFMLECRGQSK